MIQIGDDATRTTLDGFLPGGHTVLDHEFLESDRVLIISPRGALEATDSFDLFVGAKIRHFDFEDQSIALERLRSD